MSEFGMDAIERPLKNKEGHWYFAMGGASLDAFGRQRVSEVTSLLDVKQIADKQPLIMDEEIIGTATSTHSTTNASTSIATVASSDAVIRQSFQRPPYLAGKGQQFFFTFSGFDVETNITKRVGCFSSNQTTPFNSDLDGIFLESSAGDYHLKVYKTGTEVLSVARADWNGHEDAKSINFANSQILEIDYEWLGVGIIRFCFVVDGQLIVAHTYVHVGNSTSTYMTCPNQPIRYEIRQTGAGSGSLECICATAGTEGSLNQLGKEFVASTQHAIVNANTAGTFYAISGVRQKAAQPNVRIEIDTVALVSNTNDEFYWELRLNPTVAGTFAYSDITNSGAQSAIGDTSGNPSTNTVTGGTVIDFGYGAATSAEDRANRENILHPGVALDGTRDEFVLCVTPTTGNSNLDIAGGMRWKEID